MQREIKKIEEKDCYNTIIPTNFGEPVQELAISQFSANKTALLLVEKVNEIIEYLNTK